MDIKDYKVIGGKSVYGNVTLSGDPVLTILTIFEQLFSKNEFSIKNVPRTKSIVALIASLGQIGIAIKWLNTSEVHISCSKIHFDISNFEDYDFLDIVKVLSPVILFRESKCEIKNLRDDLADFYRNIGFIVEKKIDSTVIKVPNFLPEIGKYNVKSNELEDYIIIKYINYIFGNTIEIVCNSHDHRYLAAKDIQSYDKVITINPNIDELEFFVSIIMSVGGEIIFRNFDLASSLECLVLFEKIGCTYEINNSTLRIWQVLKPLESVYDFTKIDSILIGFLLILINKHITYKYAKVIIRKDPLINSIVTNLNIAGAAIVSKSSKLDSEFEVLQLKGFKPNHSLKLNIADSKIGGILLSLVLAYDGQHKISGLNELFNEHQYLKDNLEAIGVEFIY